MYKRQILDVIGTKENMGKSIGKDKNSEKITFVDILGLENAQEKVKELTEEAENELKIFKNNEFLIQFASMLCSRVK